MVPDVAGTVGGRSGRGAGLATRSVMGDAAASTGDWADASGGLAWVATAPSGQVQGSAPNVGFGHSGYGRNRRSSRATGGALAAFPPYNGPSDSQTDLDGGSLTASVGTGSGVGARGTVVVAAAACSGADAVAHGSLCADGADAVSLVQTEVLLLRDLVRAVRPTQYSSLSVPDAQLVAQQHVALRDWRGRRPLRLPRALWLRLPGLPVCRDALEWYMWQQTVPTGYWRPDVAETVARWARQMVVDLTLLAVLTAVPYFSPAQAVQTLLEVSATSVPLAAGRRRGLRALIVITHWPSEEERAGSGEAPGPEARCEAGSTAYGSGAGDRVGMDVD